MTGYGSPLHTDVNDIKTSARYGTVGDGTTQWYQTDKILDGDDVAQGAIANAAVTDPTASGTVISLLKGLLTFLRVSAAGVGKAEDAAHVSGDTGIMMLGVRNDARVTFAGADGDYTPPSYGTAGNLLVTQVPSTLSAWVASRIATTAAANSLIVKASAGKIFRLHITNGATAQFFQIHNTTTVPADAVVPIYSFRLAANESRTIEFSDFGEYFATGITVCNSTTLATKTIGAADSWIVAQYI